MSDELVAANNAQRPDAESSVVARKHSVLAQTTASKTSSIAEAEALKDGELFVFMRHDGEIPLSEGHGLGVYHRDCRYAHGYAMRFGGQPLQPLAATTRVRVQG